MDGSFYREGKYRYPIYKAPPEIVRVALFKFPYTEFSFRRFIYGKLANKEIVPYYSRAEIEKGALEGRGLEILWVSDKIDLFFLHIQGSGIVMTERGLVRVGYAAQNGHPYRSIGKYLIDIGAIDPNEVSMYSIKEWLRKNGDRVDEILNYNPSYVFFRVLDSKSPKGTIGSELTPEGSIAIDPNFLPLGVPYYVSVPIDTPSGKKSFRSLVISQDTGGAIKGALRADIYWGTGKRAEYIAAHLKTKGTLWILLPKGYDSGTLDREKMLTRAKEMFKNKFLRK